MNFGYCVACGRKIPSWMYRNALFCCEEHRKAYWEQFGRRKPRSEGLSKPEAVGYEQSEVKL